LIKLIALFIEERKRRQKMIENNKNEVHENDKLLTIIMILLNTSVLASIGLIIWSVFSIVENSTAITKFMNGSY
jgi:hypothetical protein